MYIMYIIVCLDLVFCIYFIQFYSWNKIDTQRNTAQHSATHYNTLQHPSKLCHTLHHTRYRVAKTHRMPYLQVISRKRATNYRAHLRKIKYKDKASFDSTPPCMSLASTIDMRHSHELQQSATLGNTLQHSATLGNTVQHSAALCNILQRIATFYNNLQHSVAYCNTLQHSATLCNALCNTHATCLDSTTVTRHSHAQHTAT